MRDVDEGEVESEDENEGNEMPERQRVGARDDDFEESEAGV